MNKSRILVVDDEQNIRNALRMGLKMEGFDVMAAEDGQDGLTKLETIGADAVILDLKMPKVSGMEFLKRTRIMEDRPPVIILTGHGGVDDAVEAMRQGAYDFLTKPVNIDKLVIILERAIEETGKGRLIENLKAQVDEKYNFENIIGHSKGLKAVLDKVRQIAPTDVGVLITGESGTGKEVIANAIHQNSRRKNGSFVKVHCAALSENLLESELFGHEKGAFTGATSRKKGRFELADGGTLFLDEIGEISQGTQVKLLRVLQERQFERVGGEETLEVDIRVLAATNRDLKQEVEKGNFRGDLYYRLNVVHLEIPPLRERREDIVLLARYFLHVFAKKHSKEVTDFTSEALKCIETYTWSGNVRELQNVIENGVVLAVTDKIDKKLLPIHIQDYRGQTHIQIKIGQSLAEVEKKVILMTLNASGGNKSKAARVLQIGRKTLLRKLEEYENNV